MKVERGLFYSFLSSFWVFFIIICILLSRSNPGNRIGLEAFPLSLSSRGDISSLGLVCPFYLSVMTFAGIIHIFIGLLFTVSSFTFVILSLCHLFFYLHWCSSVFFFLFISFPFTSLLMFIFILLYFALLGQKSPNALSFTCLFVFSFVHKLISIR